MDDFCGSVFWDLDLIWYTDKPRLTPCFEKTVLAWIPTIFLAIFGPLDVILAMTRRKEKWKEEVSRRRILSSIRIGICLALSFIQLLKLRDTFTLERRGVDDDEDEVMNRPPPVDIMEPMLKIFTFGAMLALAFVSKQKHVPSSGVQLAYWFLLALCEALPFYRTIDDAFVSDEEEGHGRTSTLVISLVYYPLILLQFFLHCWADTLPSSTKNSNEKAPCPEKQSSALSRLLFSWFDSLAWRGFRKPLEEPDLWELDREDSAEVIAEKFDRNWESVKLSKKSSGKNGDVGVVSVLFRTFGSYFLIGTFLTAVPDLLDIAAPRILSLLIGFIGSDEENWKGYMYAMLLLVVTLVTVLTRAQYTHIVYMTGFRVKTALMSAVYRKALRISHSAKRDATVGEIVNLMSVDVQKVLEAIPNLNMAWSSPLQISVALYLLWNTIGSSILAGVAVMVLLIPINGVLGNFSRIYQVAQMKNKDERVKLITEMISGMKVLKFHAWEESFEKKILNIRNEEVTSLRKFAILNATNEYFWFGSQFFVVLATFTTYVLSDESHVLDAHTVFVTLALINVMTVPLTALPRAIILGVQAYVSVGRLSKFLNAEEINGSCVTHENLAAEAITVDACSFDWSSKHTAETLKNVSLRIPDRSLTALVGPVGAGKSSLVAALLGELEKTNGRVNTKGSVSYVSQEAWVQNGTIRNNILFGKPYERTKYQAVIEACCLPRDLEIFLDGDETVIGERGLNLSGGQRQRISLARAVYNTADIYLLDDPLSAVDPEVGQRIFENVIGPKGLLVNKTRLLVTHDTRFLPSVDRIIVMSNGEVSQTGTYEELVASEGEFARYLREYGGNEGTEEVPALLSRNPSNAFDKADIRPRTLSSTSFSARKSIAAAFEESTFHRMQRASFRSSVRRNTKEKTETDEEKSETASIPWSLYLDYLRAGGLGLMLPSFAMYILYQVFAVSANASLTAWSNEPILNGTQANRSYYLTLYTSLGVLQSFAFLLAALLISLGSLRASTILHCAMLKRVLRAPMWFFDSTPAGRLICRFGKDVDVLDTAMANVVRLWMSVLVSVIATLAIILYTVPTFIVVCVPAALVYLVVQKLYVPTSRQLRRLESVTQAPVYSYFGETIIGVTTIRAYGQQQRFFREALRRIDRHQSCYFPTLIANRWLSVRLETIAGLIKFSAALFAVMGRDTLSPGLAGLCITYAINVTFYLGQLVRSFCDLETNIVSVERIKEYCDAPQEKPWRLAEAPPPSWPSSGTINFDNYKTRYKEGLELVLKGVDCTIESGEKVGVVGRTGAGKSSLALALFRIIEPVGGLIDIDDQDISKVGLHDLRSKLTIIPQDPVLFSGTLRFNLDPFGKFSDDAVWRALELAHLTTFVTSLPGDLEHEIAEGGSNFSVGQKQLICLARALLHKSKILVLDEATASVDLETDSLIQETIRREFHDCTVITIAHRLKTVMDCDRIIVMDAGRIREFDSPSNLLEVHNSRFYLMAKDAGLVKK